MIFSSPTTDIAFKKLFGDQKRAALTISFLNNILERREGELITEITINDNANLPPTDEQKKSFVDVSCTDQTGKKYIIEMQVARQKDFREHAQYYTAFCLANQLNKKNNYALLVPVIFVAILDFNLFKEKNYLTHHLTTDTKTGQQSLYHAEFHFIELKKFTQAIDQLVTETDKWIYLIKEADNLEQIPRQMKNSPELLEALDVLEQSAWSKRELESYFLEVDAERVRTSIEKTTYEDALKEGREKGLEEGLEKGLQKGLQKGREEGIFDVALTMLSQNFDIKIIASVTGLSIEQIKTLQKK